MRASSVAIRKLKGMTPSIYFGRRRWHNVAANKGTSMNSHTSRLLLAALLCASTVVTAQTAPRPAADPAVWGVYARLVGTRATSDKYKSAYEWRWEDGGSAIVEDQGEKWGKTRIVALGGGKLGVYSKDRLRYTGNVQPDGSVVWAMEGGLLTRALGDPYRVRIEGDAIVYEYVRVKNGAIEPTSLVVRLDDPQLGGRGTAAATTAVAATVATTRRVTPQPAPAARSTFGWLDAHIGRSFVGNRGDGVGQTLDVYREGDALALKLGLLEGGDLGRIVIRPGSTPGSLELLETWHEHATNRVAYFAGSAGAPASPVDGYYGDARVPGALVLEYDIPGGYIVLTLKPSVSATSLVYIQTGGKRTFGVRRAVGNFDYVASGWFDVRSKDVIRRVVAHSNSEQLRLQQEREVEAAYAADDEAYRLEHAAAAEQTRAAAEQALADSNARLNSTVGSVQAQQAQYRTRQQVADAAAANARRSRDVGNARAATQRQVDQAAAYAAKQRAEEQQRAAASQTPAKPTAPRTTAGTSTPGKTGGKQILGFCSGLKPGGFGGANAVIYVSEIGPVKYEFGQPLTPLQLAYAAKTGAGSVDCMVSLDRAMLERKRKEAIDNPGYPNAKRVMTGL
jgi:hypothetical protein